MMFDIAPHTCPMCGGGVYKGQGGNTFTCEDCDFEASKEEFLGR